MTSKFALVIANTEYQDASFAKLSAPGKDAEEFAEVLREPEFAAFDDVQVLLNEGEGKTRRLIARFFSERKPADLLLLYFSGHGVRNEQGQLFLAANDTEMNILEATGIPAEFITRLMNNSRSQRQLLILDCCNSGAFAYGSKSASGVGQSMGIATAFEGHGYGRVVLTATDATQYAWEGDKVIGATQKSVFTHFLIEGLKGEADRNGDGRIHVDELYDYAYEEVVRRTPKQTPGKWSYKQHGDIVLRENLKPRDVKPVPLPPELLEMLSHPNSGVRRAGIQELMSLLDSKHLGLARSAQDKLREIADMDDSLRLRKTADDILMSRGLIAEQPKSTPNEILKREQKAEKKITEPITPSKEDTEPRKKIQRPVPTTFSNVDSEPLADGGVDKQVSGSIKSTNQAFQSEKELKKPSVITQGKSPSIVQAPTSSEKMHEEVKTDGVLRQKLHKQKNITFPLIILFAAILGILLVVKSLSAISSTNTPIVPATPIATMMSDKDGMIVVYVPPGDFTMGTMGGDRGGEDERPVHTVYLDAFWIDKTEVTNKMYTLCVAAGSCQEPVSKKSRTRPSYYGNTDFDNYPVIYVDWNMAKAYCEWARRRLPTEAEWEKAARGTDGRTYPWGNQRPNDNLLNYYDANDGDTTEAGRYPNGASPYGALDMAGNVREWVADWYDYDNTYYASSPRSNPSGPDSGQYRVLRGGTYGDSDYGVRSAGRNWESPTDTEDYFGFRCAMSVTQ